MEEEYRQSFKRIFKDQNLNDTYIHFDGYTARNEFLRDGWNYAIEQGWLRVVNVDGDQETYMKGYLTEKGQKEVLIEG